MRPDSVPAESPAPRPAGARRIALFDFTDVFEDFYPHIGVDRASFSTTWKASGNHRFAAALQQHVGDVTWYELSLRRGPRSAQHDAGHRVTFVRSSAAHRFLWKVFYARSWSWRLRRGYRGFTLASSYLAPASVDLARVLRADSPDVLFVQDYSSGKFDVLLALARLLRVPLVAYHSGSTLDSYAGAALRRLTLRRADAVLVSSSREADHIARAFGVDRARCEVVLTPIDLDVFRPIQRDAALRAAGLAPDRRYLLFVGRFDDRVKRVTSLLRAFARAAARHDDATLVVVGDGPDADRIRRAADGLPERRVLFLGWEDDPQRLAALYSCAEALVLPSLREGFPTVVGEALACGTPVIASDVGGISEVVDSRTGWLVPPGDERALEAAIAAALDGGDEAAMRPAARAVAQRRLSPASVGDALARILGPLMRR